VIRPDDSGKRSPGDERKRLCDIQVPHPVFPGRGTWSLLCGWYVVGVLVLG
jgi:hypothetical protein